MRRLTNFYDFRFKSTATAAIGIHPSKAWLLQLVNFKHTIWMWGHFRRTICNKIVLNFEKMPQKRMECFRLLLDHLAWIEHKFLSVANLSQPNIIPSPPAAQMQDMEFKVHVLTSFRLHFSLSWVATVNSFAKFLLKIIRQCSLRSVEANILDFDIVCPSWGCRIHWHHLCREVRHSNNECIACDIKQSNSIASVIPELWGMQITASVALPSGSFWPWVVASDTTCSITNDEMYIC